MNKLIKAVLVQPVEWHHLIQVETDINRARLGATVHQKLPLKPRVDYLTLLRIRDGLAAISGADTERKAAQITTCKQNFSPHFDRAFPPKSTCYMCKIAPKKFQCFTYCK